MDYIIIIMLIIVLVGNEIGISNQRKLYKNLEHKITEMDNRIKGIIKSKND